MNREDRSEAGSPQGEREIAPPKDDPGARATDDHAADTARQVGQQPTSGLDPAVDAEHLRSPSQGVRPADAEADTRHEET